MGREDTAIAVGYGRAHGRLAYDAGATPDSKTVFAKGFIYTDGAGGVFLEDAENIDRVVLVGNDIRVFFETGFRPVSPRYGVYFSQSDPAGGAAGPFREFQNARNKTQTQFDINAETAGAVPVNHGAVVRGYSVMITGRDEVAG